MIPPDPRRRALVTGAAAGVLAPALARAEEQPGSPEQANLARLRDRVISVADYGYKGNSNADGTTGDDDTQAFRRAIAAASTRNIGTIVIPFGETGFSRVDGKIVDGVLRPGLRFVGEGCGPGRRFDVGGLTIVYTGPDACWDIYQAPGWMWSLGENSWEHLGFHCTHDTGTMFGLNRPFLTASIGGSSMGDRGVMANVHFSHCLFYGAENDKGGGLWAAGYGIHAVSVMSLHVDSSCYFRGWKRAIWMIACDNSFIEMQGQWNGRYVQNEKRVTSCNDNHIALKQAWSGHRYMGEPMYQLWDNGGSTRITGMTSEPVAPITACLYLGGTDTILHACYNDGAAPFFQLAPSARNVVMVGCSQASSEKAPIIEAPDSWNWSGYYETRQMTVIAPSKGLTEALPSHPRLRVIGGYGIGTQVGLPERPVPLVDARGVRQPKFAITPSTYNGLSVGIGFSGIGMVEDAGASEGWAIRFRARMSDGFRSTFVIGRHFRVGDHVRVIIRSRVAAALTAGWLECSLTGAGTSSATLRLHAAGGSATAYRTDSFTIDLGSARDGEVLTFQAYAASAPSADALVDSIAFEVVTPAIAPVGDTATPAEMARAINALIAAVQRGVPSA